MHRRVTIFALVVAMSGVFCASASADTEVKETMGVLSVTTPAGETGKFELAGLSGGKTFVVTSFDSALTKFTAVGGCKKVVLVEIVTCTRANPFKSVVVKTSDGNDVVSVDVQPNAYPVADAGQEPFQISTGDGDDKASVAVAMISAFVPGRMPVLLGAGDDTFDGSKSTGVSFDVTPGFGDDTVIGSAAVANRSTEFRPVYADRFNAESKADGKDTFSDPIYYSDYPAYYAEVSYAKRANKVEVSLDDVANDGYAGEQDNVQSTIQTVRGGSDGDMIDVSGKNVSLLFTVKMAFGGDGADIMTCKGTTVVGRGSYECALIGEDGNDMLDGADTGYEQDLLYGGKGDDTLRSNDTVLSTTFYEGVITGDVLFGGDGADTMIGGKGPDTFHMSGSSGFADGADIVKNDGKNRVNRGDIVSYSRFGNPDENFRFADFSIWNIGGPGYRDVYDATLEETARSGPVQVTLDGKANDGALSGENDNIENQSVALVRGGAGDDNLDGEKVFGNRQGMLSGAGGEDHLSNARGSYGGEGNDVIVAAPEGSEIQGGEGNDDITGQVGADNIYGNYGNDQLDGGGGDDRLEGGRGSDNVNGDAGEDTLYDDYEDTYPSSSASVDINVLDGGAGNDKLKQVESRQLARSTYHGGEGDDMLTTEIISGPNRVLNPANEGVQLYGDGGNDTIQVDPELYSRDIGHGGAGNDKLYVGKAYGDDDDDQLFGYTANQCSPPRQDTVVDSLRGGAGNDWLVGGGGADELHGESGNDLLVGGYACGAAPNPQDAFSDRYTNDRLQGDDGKDVLVGGVDDLLSAGADDDLVQIKSDNAYSNQLTVGDISGGDGTDTVSYGSDQPAVICSVQVSLDNKPNDGTNSGGASSVKSTHNVHDDVENLDGTRCDDQLSGSRGANVLDGGSGGKDTLTGLAGLDILRGSTDGNATIFARDGERDEVSCGPARLGLTGSAEIDLQDSVTNCSRVDDGRKAPDGGEKPSPPVNPPAPNSTVPEQPQQPQTSDCAVVQTKGMPVAKALQSLDQKHCVVRLERWWVAKKLLHQKVLAQSLKPGKYQAGSKIILRVGKKTTVAKCRISRVTGKSLTAGLSRLRSQQCNVEIRYRPVSSRSQKGKILGQSVRGVVRSATTIRIIVGS